MRITLVCRECCDDNYAYSEYRDTYITYEDRDQEEEDGIQRRLRG